MTTNTIDGVPPGGFRTLLGAFATGVTVLTTRDDDGNPLGMTASAVSSVSLEPPLLLVCINVTGRMCGVLRKDRPFALSILAEDQAAISERFAQDPDPFDGTRCTDTASGLRLIDHSAAHIECVVWDLHEAGDHIVFFGRIERGAIFDRRPLIHHRSVYRTITD